MVPTLTPAAAVLILLGVMEPVLSAGGRQLVAAGGAAVPETDIDRDGVSDPSDACAQTPYGYPVNTDGCALDSDGDGVADGADRCPATRPGSGGVDEGVDASGCSVRDRKRERDLPYSSGVG